MKKILVFLFLLGMSLNAQHTISGSFSPADDYSWLIAYHLKATDQVYITDSSIKNGAFTLKFSESNPPGMYRLVYAVPQDVFYFDIIYNGNEDIKLNFNSEQGAKFIASQENKLFNSYFRDLQTIERRLIEYYSAGTTEPDLFIEILEKYKTVQKNYEDSTEGLFANQFIKANKPYIPSAYENVKHYVKSRKASYFDHLDLANSDLQASGFLVDKLINYVFTALPIDQLEQPAIEKEMQANIDTVFIKLKNTSDEYSFYIMHTLWTKISENELNNTADYTYNTYLKNSPVATSNAEIIDKIETQNRLRIGARAPELSWKKGVDLEKLSTLDGAENYVIIFWSSTCGHCLKELPMLHKELKNNNKIKVVAVGLEDDITSWQIESKKLADFEHVIALGKWESEYAKLYDIYATPTYYILNADKRIVAKPENDKDIVEFLRNVN